MSKQSTNKLHTNQSGLVSILVSMAFIILLTLITTSFALLMRREQRQALDRQLSAQAFYAAESGINDAIKNINSGGAASQDCSNTSTVVGGSTDLGDGLSVSCVLIDKTPSSLEYTIPKDESKVVPILTQATIGKIKISWQAGVGQTNFAPTSPTFNFPQGNLGTTVNIGDVGMLRVSAMPVTGSVSRATLAANTQTTFLYPQPGSGTPNQRPYSTNIAAQGDIVSGKCNSGNTPYCSVEITNLSGTNNYYLRLRSIYKDSNVTIKAYGTDGITELPMLGNQVKIDSTGKANDVLRRIQVRVPIDNQFTYPEFAIETADDICKLLLAIPPNTVQDNLCYTDTDALPPPPPPPPAVDVCLNIAGNQATLPAGYIVDSYGICTIPVPPPPPPPPCQPTPNWWSVAIWGPYPEIPSPCTH